MGDRTIDVINDILKEADPRLKHNETVEQIEHVFRKYRFYTTREYPIFKMKDKSGRKGRIDLVARKGKFKVALEYDHHALIKWKSFQKIVQIKPDVAIGITGSGPLEPNFERGMRYVDKLTSLLYVISLKEGKFIVVTNGEYRESFKN